MKNIILSILGSILLTSFVIGSFIFIITSHAELLLISGVVILLVVFYICIKWLLEDLD